MEENIWKRVGNTYLNLFSSLLPINPWKSKKYFKKLNDLKDCYKEKIEYKTGIELGDIIVKPRMDFLNDSYYSLMEGTFEELNNDYKKTISEKIRAVQITDFLYKFSYPILAIYSLIGNNSNNASYHNGNIYFPTGFWVRLGYFVDNDFFSESKDEALVHELSHALWHKINSKDESCLDEWRTWSEGFAMYGQKDYFKEFYPESHSSEKYILSKVYRQGYEKVSKIIQKHGLESYLEIPSKWKEFEKELSKFSE